MSGTRDFKCPNCDGIVTFDSATQSVKCPYCDAQFDPNAFMAYDAELKQESEELSFDLSSGEWAEGEAEQMRVYACRSCGGEIIVEATTSASSCPFCGSAVVMKGQLAGKLRPDYVIPFRVSKAQAKEGLKKFMKGKWLAPRIFRNVDRLDSVKGLYVPFWFFNAEVDATVRFSAYRVPDDDLSEVERCYALFRSGSAGFRHIPVDGSKKMPDALMESIEPFNFKEARAFRSSYLAGYLADRFDVDADQSRKRAEQRLYRTTEDAFRETVPPLYSNVRAVNSRVTVKESKTLYVLCPVWLLNTTWKGKRYTFAMNGQTGKFIGDLPIDKKRAFWLWLGLSLLGGGVIYLLLYLLRQGGLLG